MHGDTGGYTELKEHKVYVGVILDKTKSFETFAEMPLMEVNKYCPKDKKFNYDEKKFCPECGTDLREYLKIKDKKTMNLGELCRAINSNELFAEVKKDLDFILLEDGQRQPNGLLIGKALMPSKYDRPENSFSYVDLIEKDALEKLREEVQIKLKKIGVTEEVKVYRWNRLGLSS